MVPSLETAPVDPEANGLTALITCGSLATLAVAWFTADWSEADGAVPGVEHDLARVPALLREFAVQAVEPERGIGARHGVVVHVGAAEGPAGAEHAAEDQHPGDDDDPVPPGRECGDTLEQLVHARLPAGPPPGTLEPLTIEDQGAGRRAGCHHPAGVNSPGRVTTARLPDRGRLPGGHLVAGPARRGRVVPADPARPPHVPPQVEVQRGDQDGPDDDRVEQHPEGDREPELGQERSPAGCRGRRTCRPEPRRPR